MPFRGSNRKPLLCFVHVERAAGTTLHAILRKNYPSFLTLTSPKWTNDERTVLTSAQLRALLRILPFTAGVGGHNVRTYLGYEDVTERPIQYLTFLRDPVARYLSHLRYQLEHFPGRWDVGRLLDEEYFWDFTTKRIAGSVDLELAKRRLDGDYAFVGLQERFDESLVLLRRALAPGRDVDFRYEHLNVSASPARWVRDPGVRRHAEERNAADLELYAFAETAVYRTQAEAYGRSLAVETEELRSRSVGYRVPPANRFAWRAYKALAQIPVEAVVRRIR
jgi:Galactose-3-O-sulfotransferase